MESELPILLYLLSFALAAIAAVPALRPFGPQMPIQIPCRSRPDLTVSLNKP